MEGGCSCGYLRYRLAGPLMIVHACHCRWCQRETGSVHALNAVWSAEALERQRIMRARAGLPQKS